MRKFFSNYINIVHQIHDSFCKYFNRNGLKYSQNQIPNVFNEIFQYFNLVLETF